MLKTALISSCLAGLAYYFTDLTSNSVLLSRLLPALLLVSALVFALTLVLLLHRWGVKQTFSSSGEFTDID